MLHRQLGQAFRRFEIDLLYSVHLCGSPALLYLVFEHQSTFDRLMPLRMYGRILRVLEWYADQQGGSRDCLPLPVVIPIVLHHSETGWSAATRFEALFEPVLLAEPEIAALVPHFGFILDDLSHVSDEELGRRALDLVATLTLWALRDGRRDLERLRASLRFWAQSMSDLAAGGSYGREALERIFRYLVGVNDELTTESFGSLLEALPNDTKETIMTLAEQFEARGQIKGEAIGKAKGERELLLRLLERKFGDLPDSARQRIETAEEPLLIRWAERVLSAGTLAEIFEE